MKSMAFTQPKTDGALASPEVSDSQPQFPDIDLKGPQAEAAGITDETAGDIITLKIKCKVKSVGERYGAPDEEQHAPVMLQVTHAEVVPDDETEETEDQEQSEEPGADETGDQKFAKSVKSPSDLGME